MIFSPEWWDAFRQMFSEPFWIVIWAIMGVGFVLLIALSIYLWKLAKDPEP